MLKQFNLQQLRFDNPVITTDEEGQPIITTHGEGWYTLTIQEQIDGINASIVGNGEVWEENGEIHYSGSQPTVWHFFDREQKRWRLPNEEERQAERQAYLEALRIAKLNEINEKAQNFVCHHAELKKTPDFERATWQEQANEAIAWHADNNTPTPTLDTIAQNRNVPVVVLRQKAYEKTMQFRFLTNTIAGQRQHFEDLLKMAKTAEEIEGIEVVYQLPTEVDNG
ncbi:hypothetical protein P9J58_04950 [Glaesserella parasuis]|uniref:hypothetical protein n=1 Tax=Glaesserella parasuis TaxID=738 RepID=UPI0024150E8A|nr:hypothetical protein [Glaesserella parasuis]MDG4923208.1 hypothetical protein [Glaesserella parasuis]MDG6260920.1 hypothetical protein [Glaesserella parasuis]MDO9665661.1 hypothetical protein [Glaesserella parasuis]MDO9728586.1 hypothetical protein [Glaesserella parasuis]MDO9735967.1 hypothetical protein [Glaesserella parasuis]